MTSWLASRQGSISSVVVDVIVVVFVGEVVVEVVVLVVELVFLDDVNLEVKGVDLGEEKRSVKAAEVGREAGRGRFLAEDLGDSAGVEVGVALVGGSV